MRILVTGITGQDGAYLAQYLLSGGHEVFGAFRRTSSVNFWRLQELNLMSEAGLSLVEYDLTDQSSAINLLDKIKPDQVFNLAAQSFVGVSFRQPNTTAQITGLGVVNLLEAIKIVNSDIKFYQASTSEMFGKVQEVPQSESTPFYPRSPYGIAKLFAHWMAVNYKESYDMFCASGILFNHESPLRGLEFVTRKITDGLVRVHLGLQEQLVLGNLDAKRDWGYAADYVEGMFKMLQVDSAENYVLATGRTTTIRDFVSLAAKSLDIAIDWQGEGVSEIGVDKRSGKTIVIVSPEYFRPAEVELLIGDSSKARSDLNWEPKTSLESLCEMMIKADYNRVKKV